MEQLQIIINEGKKINDTTISPTIDERLKIKIDILRLISDKESFVMNKKLFEWKKSLVDKVGDSQENTEWLLEPISIYCYNPDEMIKKLCNGLHEKGYKYVRGRNDMYGSRLILDVEFEINAFINPMHKNLMKHSNNFSFYGANLNTNGELMLPIFLYEYITPKFNYENWKDNLELEPFLWEEMKQKWIKKGVNPIKYNTIDISSKLFNLIKSEDESAYLFTGNYTYFMMTNQKGEYNGDYHVFHRQPMEFLKKINESIPDLKIREEMQLYYFQPKQYQLAYNNEIILTVYNLEFPLNFVRLGFYNHINYHGLLLFLLLEALKSSNKDYEEKIGQIGYLVKFKNGYKDGHNFNILQNNIIGPKTSPELEFKKKEWNKKEVEKEFTFFFYRPDVTEEKEDETDSV